MYPDFKEHLSIFDAHRVKYLIVGGYAVSFHAQPRVTKDIDLLNKPDAETSKAVYAALAKFGANGSTNPYDLSESVKLFLLGREPIAVDILPEIDGIAPPSTSRVGPLLPDAKSLTSLATEVMRSKKESHLALGIPPFQHRGRATPPPSMRRAFAQCNSTSQSTAAGRRNLSSTGRSCATPP